MTQRTHDKTGRNVRNSIAQSLYGFDIPEPSGESQQGNILTFRHPMTNSLNKARNYDYDKGRTALAYLKAIPQEGGEPYDASKLLTSLLDARIAMMGDLENGGDSSDLGYAWDGDEWVIAPKDASEGKPWYRTSKEALNAIFEEGLRDSDWNLPNEISGMTIDDLYREANEYLLDKVQGNQAAYKYAQEHYNPDKGETFYAPKGTLRTIASIVAPTRVWDAIDDQEVKESLTPSEWARLAALDAGETALTFTPGMAFKVAGKLGSKGMSVLEKVMPKAASAVSKATHAPFNNRFVKGAVNAADQFNVSHPMLASMGRNAVGNAGVYTATKGAEKVLDPDNTTQSNEWNPYAMAFSALTGGLSPLLYMGVGNAVGGVGSRLNMNKGNNFADMGYGLGGTDANIRRFLSKNLTKSEQNIRQHNPRDWTKEDISEVKDAPSWHSWFNSPMAKFDGFDIDNLPPPPIRKRTAVDPRGVTIKVGKDKIITRDGVNPQGKNVEVTARVKPSDTRENVIDVVESPDFGKLTPEAMEEWIMSMTPNQQKYFSSPLARDDLRKLANENVEVFNSFINRSGASPSQTMSGSYYAELRDRFDNQALGRYLKAMALPHNITNKADAQAAVEAARKLRHKRMGGAGPYGKESKWNETPFASDDAVLRNIDPNKSNRVASTFAKAFAGTAKTAGRHFPGMKHSDIIPFIEESGPYRYGFEAFPKETNNE